LKFKKTNNLNQDLKPKKNKKLPGKNSPNNLEINERIGKMIKNTNNTEEGIENKVNKDNQQPNQEYQKKVIEDMIAQGINELHPLIN